MRIVGDVGDSPFDNVVPENKFEGDKVQGGHFERIDKINKPVKNGNEGLRKQNQIGPGDRGDSAACADNGTES